MPGAIDPGKLARANETLAFSARAGAACGKASAHTITLGKGSLKMTQLFALIALVSLVAFAPKSFSAAPSTVDFSKINFEGVRVLDKDGQDNFMYAMKLVPNPSPELIGTLENEAVNKAVSPIFELNEKSSFKNIYVYVGKTDEGKFEFVEALVNKSGSIFIVDMDITNVEKSEMTAVHGPSDDLQTLTIKLKTGNLFP
jgi:hypothetical protein